MMHSTNFLRGEQLANQRYAGRVIGLGDVLEEYLLLRASETACKDELCDLREIINYMLSFDFRQSDDM